VIGYGIEYNEYASDHMNQPPNSTDNRNTVRLFISFSNLLSQGLCPYSPIFLH